MKFSAKRNGRAGQGSKIYGRVFQGGLSLQVTVECSAGAGDI